MSYNAGPPAPGREAALALARTLIEGIEARGAAWHYEEGLFLGAARAAGAAWGDEALASSATRLATSLVGPGGSIEGYREGDYNLDQVNPGKNLFGLPDPDGRFARALDALAGQLERQPRTASGGYWHKAIYPDQMWLDGLYMAQPFRARYAADRGRKADFDDIARQFVLMEGRARDPRTGLLRHGWDESRRQLWADPETGLSPNAWGRAVGWFAMALVDCLDWFPAGHPGADALRDILRRLAAAVLAVRDPDTGLWRQVLDQGDRAGNYLEASASCMLSYALAKGVRLGVLSDADSGRASEAALESATARFIRLDEAGWAHIEGSCAVAGLGGKPYRDGSYAYYVSEPVRTDDCKGAGPFILASIEYDRRKAR